MNAVKFSAVIVDSDKESRKRLKELLADYVQVGVEKECSTLEEVKRYSREACFDILFGDMEEIGGESLEIVSRVGEGVLLVCMSKGGEGAVQAFEMGAVDYLVKPFCQERLERTMKRLFALRGGSAMRNLGQFLLKAGTDLRSIDPSSIAYILSDDHVTTIYFSDGAMVHTGRSMKDWEREVLGRDFYRLDRSVIVNRSRIVSFERLNRDAGVLKFDGELKPLKIGRAAMQRLRELRGRVFR